MYEYVGNKCHRTRNSKCQRASGEKSLKIYAVRVGLLLWENNSRKEACKRALLKTDKMLSFI